MKFVTAGNAVLPLEVACACCGWVFTLSNTDGKSVLCQKEVQGEPAAFMTAVSHPVTCSVILDLARGFLGLYLDVPSLVVLDHLLDTVCKEFEVGCRVQEVALDLPMASLGTRGHTYAPVPILLYPAVYELLAPWNPGFLDVLDHSVLFGELFEDKKPCSVKIFGRFSVDKRFPDHEEASRVVRNIVALWKGDIRGSFSRWCKVTPDNSILLIDPKLLLLVLTSMFVAVLEPLLLHLALNVLVDMPHADLLVCMSPHTASCVLECFVEIGNKN